MEMSFAEWRLCMRGLATQRRWITRLAFTPILDPAVEPTKFWGPLRLVSVEKVGDQARWP